MKKNILFLGLAAMSLFTVASCSSDDDLQAGMSIGAGDNVITLALNPGGSGMASRAARPVTSSEAANNVDKVVVKLYQKDGENYSLVSETENGQTIYEQDVTWSQGTKTANIALKHLAQGSYKLVARGYNNTSTAVTFDEGSTTGVSAINWTATATGKVEEVFAGELDITVDAEGKITGTGGNTLTMSRRVAGFLAYFKNIPTKVNEDVVKSVRVVASNKATQYDIIGGTVANAVGEEMKKLAEREQVIAITHLAQIASRASSHYLVEKEEKNGRTMTRIRCVEGEERVKEIARLLSGETSDLSLEHARMLLKVQC